MPRKHTEAALVDPAMATADSHSHSRSHSHSHSHSHSRSSSGPGNGIQLFLAARLSDQEKKIAECIDMSQDTTYNLVHQEIANYHHQITASIVALAKAQAEFVGAVVPRLEGLEREMGVLREELSSRDHTLLERLNWIDTGLSEVVRCCGGGEGPVRKGVWRGRGEVDGRKMFDEDHRDDYEVDNFLGEDPSEPLGPPSTPPSDTVQPEDLHEELPCPPTPVAAIQKAPSKKQTVRPSAPKLIPIKPLQSLLSQKRPSPPHSTASSSLSELTPSESSYEPSAGTGNTSSSNTTNSAPPSPPARTRASARPIVRGKAQAERRIVSSSKVEKRKSISGAGAAGGGLEESGESKPLKRVKREASAASLAGVQSRRTSAVFGSGARSAANISKIWPEKLEGKDAMQLVMCDKCDAWLHWGCVGFNAEIVKSSELFICPPCLQDGDSAAPRRTSRKAPEGICPRPDCTLKQVNKRAQPAEEEFTIEKLIGKRRGKDSADGEATWEYLVMWEGYPCDVSEWLPEHDIGGVKALSARFDKEVADEGLTPKGDKELILLNLAVKWGWLKRS